MSIRASLLIASCKLAGLANGAMPATFAYFKKNGIKFTGTMSDCVGTVTLARIADHGNGRFDFDPQGFPALVCEVMGKDGETAIDLIAWPIDRPDRVLTMFGRCGLIGLHYATNPASYAWGDPLPIYRTPLDLFRAGYRGAAVAIPRIAATEILELPGNVAGVDLDHGRSIQDLLKTVISGRVLVPANRRVAA